jgi:hypothetical protein
VIGKCGGATEYKAYSWLEPGTKSVKQFVSYMRDHIHGLFSHVVQDDHFFVHRHLYSPREPREQHKERKTGEKDRTTLHSESHIILIFAVLVRAI